MLASPSHTGVLLLFASFVLSLGGGGARVLGGGGGGVPVAGLRTFTVALKNVKLEPGVETTLLARPGGGSGGCLTQLWFTAETTWLAVGDEALLRVYVDGEDTPSIAGPLGPLHGMGLGSDGGAASALKHPWSAGASMGKLASLGGGFWSSHRIPFGSGGVRVTIEAMAQVQSRAFYFMARGLAGDHGAVYPVVLPHSFVQLPDSARLRVFETDVALPPLDYATLCNVSGQPAGGALYLVTQQIVSGSAHCLEGIHEVRGLGGGGDGDEGWQQLSSGFEDYFLSGQYFDAGPFHTPLSGLTHEDRLLEPRRLSAYRFHTADPVLFGAERFELRWRNGMHNTGPLAANTTNLRAFVWLYVW